MQYNISPASFAMPADALFTGAVAEEPAMVVTIAEATRLLSVGRSTVYKLLNERSLTLIKIGSATRILRSSLDTFLSRAAVQARSCQNV